MCFKPFGVIPLDYIMLASSCTAAFNKWTAEDLSRQKTAQQSHEREGVNLMA
jgi:hypothetical protein